MGIPEERLKSVDIGIRMNASDVTRAAVMTSACTGVTSACTGGAVTSARSPDSSNSSHTDSDDSVDVRVRSPAQPKYRKRPRDSRDSRDSPMKADVLDVKADVLDVETTKLESDGSDSERGVKRGSLAGGFVVPKKRFRRDYEASTKLEDRSDVESDEGRDRDEEEASRVTGCARHRRRVVFECAACLEHVATRFGWPAHALRTPPAAPQLPTLALPVLPPMALPFAPFVDPLLAFRALGGDVRLAAGLLAGAAPGPVPAPASASVLQRPARRPSPLPVARPAPPPPQEDAPLDLTRRTSSTTTSSSSGGGGGRFSIENILAGRTAAASEQHPASRGVAHRPSVCPPRPSPLLPSPPARPLSKKSSPSPSSAPPPSTPRRAVIPAAQGGERRELANERERMRVKHLTGAFKELSSSIGGIASECIGTSGVKFTKVAILRTASLYIGYLSHLLSDGAGPTEEKVYDQMRSAILEVMTSKSKKGKDDDDEDEEEM